MKIGEYLLRAYFLIAGIGGLGNILRNPHSEVDLTFIYVVGTVLLAVASISMLMFAFKFKYFISEQKLYIQGVLTFLLLNFIGTVYWGSRGENFSTGFQDLPKEMLFMSILIGVVFYGAMIYVVEYIHKNSIDESKPSGPEVDSNSN